MTVPCLGALTEGHLLAHAAAGVALRIVDRGWCEGCNARTPGEPPGHPAGAAFAAAALWLEAVESPPWASLVHEPLPLQERPETLPAAPEELPRLSRRRFFESAIDRSTRRRPR